MTADDPATPGHPQAAGPDGTADRAGRWGDDPPAREPADPPDGAARPERSPPEPPPEDGDSGWVPM